MMRNVCINYLIVKNKKRLNFDDQISFKYSKESSNNDLDKNKVNRINKLCWMSVSAYFFLHYNLTCIYILNEPYMS